jgi:hypothetical protein
MYVRVKKPAPTRSSAIWRAASIVTSTGVPAACVRRRISG